MTGRELMHILEKISYKPGYRFETSWVTYHKVLLTISVELWDSDAPTTTTVVRQNTMFDAQEFSRADQIVHLVRETVRHLELHEMNEWLKFENKRVREAH